MTNLKILFFIILSSFSFFILGGFNSFAFAQENHEPDIHPQIATSSAKELVSDEVASGSAVFAVSYHLENDINLENPIKKKYISAGKYLMKITSAIALSDNPHIIIDAEGVANDVTHDPTEKFSENTYLYKRTILNDSQAYGLITENISMHEAFDLNGNLLDNEKVQGAKFIDTVNPTVIFSDNKLSSFIKSKDRILVTASFTEAGKIDEENKPKITIGTFVQNKEMVKKDNKTWFFVWDVPITEDILTNASISISAFDEAGNLTQESNEVHSYLIDNFFFLNFAAIPPPSKTCKNAQRTIRYHVSAIDVVIPVNGWGDVNPMGVMYALNNINAIPNVSQIKDRDFKLYDSTDQSIPKKTQPLVLRANMGDCVEVILRNELDTAYGDIDPLTLQPIHPSTNKRKIGMQVFGLPYDPKTSDGAFFGQNPDTTVAPGEEKVYRWFAQREGGYMFRDNSNIQWPQDTTTKGLFGMLIVEPKGSTWRDSITGRNFLLSNDQYNYNYDDLLPIGKEESGKNIYLGVGASIFADIHQPQGVPLPKGALLLESISGNDYRDYALIMHDEFEGIKGPVAWNEDGAAAFFGKPFFPSTGIEDETFLINYRSEPLRNRQAAWERHRGLIPVPGIGLVDGSKEGVKESKETRVTVTPPFVKIEFLKEEEVIYELTVNSKNMSVMLPNGKVFDPKDDFCQGGKFMSDNGRSEDPNYTFYKCVGEEAHLQSWPFGDPAVAMPRAYWGDPIVLYVGSADSHDTHSFHQHAHRWFHNPNQADISKLPIPENAIQKSTRLDVQSVGATEVFKLVYEQGAGSVTGTAGDSIFHCHLYPHFSGGIWSALRVFDRLKINSKDSLNIQATLADGTPLFYPDGTAQAVLQPLPARIALYDTFDPKASDKRTKPPPGMANRVPLPADIDHPGYPGFIAGKFGQKALQPPMFVIDPANGEPIKDRAVPTMLEKKASYDGIRPGVALVDPCAGVNGEFGRDRKPDRIYEPVAIQIPFIQNLKGGFFYPEQRAYVEKELVEKIRRDPTQLQPYSFRANVGDCVEVHTTNNLQPDDQTTTLGVNDGVFHSLTNTPEISQHIHPVRFDQLGTDGTSVGWNYDISNRSGETAAYRWFIDVNVRTIFSHDHQFPTSHQQGGLWAAFINEPLDSKYLNPETGDPLGPTLSSQTYELTSKKYTPENVKGIGTRANIVVENPISDISGGISGGGISAFREFIVHYSDFTPSFVTDPKDLTQALEDYKNGNTQAFFNPNLRTNPFNPPFEIDDYLADQGISTINYQIEPFRARVRIDDPLAKEITKNPAYVFSSIIHGDPETEVFRSYAGDPIVIRVMDGAHEEHHTFEIHGHRWLHQPSNPHSILTDNQAFNIGEFFNFELIGNTRLGNTALTEDNKLAAGLPGDYLFASGSMSEITGGVWGIFRVENGQKSNLAPLPGNSAPPSFENLGLLDQVINTTDPIPAVSEELTQKNSPCPTNAPLKKFDISAIQRPILYNGKNNETDPFGLMYTLTNDKEAVLAGTKGIEPLVIRASEGDCIEIKLRNDLPDLTGIAQNTIANLPDGAILPASLDSNTLQHVGDAQHGAITDGLPDNPIFKFAKWPMSNRVSLHPRLLKTAVSVGDGATVGYMRDQTIGPGESTTYLWYADDELGAILLDDYADLRSHRHHGLYAGLIIEPKNTIFLDPKDPTLKINPLKAKHLESGTSAIILNTKTKKWFREMVPFFATGLNLRKDEAIIADAKGMQEPTAVEHQPCSPVNALCQDVEQSGEVGINYRTERLENRVPFNLDGGHAGHPNEINFNPDAFSVFSSSVFGDPATPVFEAFVKDPTVFRVLLPGENSNVHTIGIQGHNFEHEQEDKDSNIVNSEGSITSGKVLNMNLLGGAGGEQQLAGDYSYGTRNHVEPSTQQGGLWGIFRVLEEDSAANIVKLASNFDFDNEVLASFSTSESKDNSPKSPPEDNPNKVSANLPSTELSTPIASEEPVLAKKEKKSVLGVKERDSKKTTSKDNFILENLKKLPIQLALIALTAIVINTAYSKFFRKKSFKK